MKLFSQISNILKKHPQNQKKLPAFFLLGCARSGTTSICNIIDQADNVVCLSEPAPNLNIESRDLIDGRLLNPIKILEKLVLPRISEVVSEGKCYGEKSITMIPFIPYLNELFDAKFVVIQRDGRDVTTSLLNWHNEVFGTVYRECKDPGDLSETAEKALYNLPIELDTSDYNRPRPHPGDPWFDKWADLSRFEMCAWYWAHTIRLTRKMLDQVDSSCWRIIDYTDPKPSDIQEIYDFLGLSGFDKNNVQNSLDKRINSVQERTGIKQRFPSWPHWNRDLQKQFFRIAGAEMYSAGYTVEPFEQIQWKQIE